MEHFRAFAYPIGFIASVCFGARFWLQLYKSEKEKKTVVPKSFWYLSLIGNIVLCLHSVIQVQFPVAFIQTVNGFVSWRNIDFASSSPKTFKYSLRILLFLIVAITLVFILQSVLVIGYLDWIRTPQMPWEKGDRSHLNIVWHIFGLAGMLLFAARFWVQWWKTESLGKSHLGTSFWWMSLVGASLSLIYFLRSGDYVHVLGYGLGLIPYVRNLMFRGLKNS